MPQYFWSDRGYTFCTKCRGSRPHRIGFDIHIQEKQVPVKECQGCGLITERKPKVIKRDRYDKKE